MEQALKYKLPETWSRKSSNALWPRSSDIVKRWYNESRKTHYQRIDEGTKKAFQECFFPNRRLSRVAPYRSPVITSLLKAIDASKAEFPSHDNWDQEGSVGYSESTWRRVNQFLIRNAIHFSRSRNFSVPEILPGPDGSIDLLWRTKSRELLINVPPGTEALSFYGDDREDGTKDAIKGKKLDESADNDWIFLWLTK